MITIGDKMFRIRNLFRRNGTPVLPNIPYDPFREALLKRINDGKNDVEKALLTDRTYNLLDVGGDILLCVPFEFEGKPLPEDYDPKIRGWSVQDGDDGRRYLALNNPIRPWSEVA